MSRVMRKPAFRICDASAADQCLPFRYIDSTIPLLVKSEISSIHLSSVVAQSGLIHEDTRYKNFIHQFWAQQGHTKMMHIKEEKSKR